VTTPLVDEPARTSRVGRIVVSIAVVLMLGMWGYVLYLAIGPGRQASPDRLEDPAFAEQAADRCRAANERVQALPTADRSPTAADRADVLDDANAIYGSMLDELETLVPDGEDGEITQEWIADWRVYLDDRADFARRLRVDEDARLLVSPKHGEQITESIDAFAQDNRISACGTPADA
jgi:hypothetical protein